MSDDWNAREYTVTYAGSNRKYPALHLSAVKLREIDVGVGDTVVVSRDGDRLILEKKIAESES